MGGIFCYLKVYLSRCYSYKAKMCQLLAIPDWPKYGREGGLEEKRKCKHSLNGKGTY